MGKVISVKSERTQSNTGWCWLEPIVEESHTQYLRGKKNHGR